MTTCPPGLDPPASSLEGGWAFVPCGWPPTQRCASGVAFPMEGINPPRSWAARPPSPLGPITLVGSRKSLAQPSAGSIGTRRLRQRTSPRSSAAPSPSQPVTTTPALCRRRRRGSSAGGQTHMDRYPTPPNLKVCGGGAGVPRWRSAARPWSWPVTCTPAPCQRKAGASAAGMEPEWSRGRGSNLLMQHC